MAFQKRGETMRIRMKTLLKKSIIIVSYTVFAIFLIGCTTTQINTAIDTYGESNAYDQYNGIDLTLQNGTAYYYIGCSTDYLTAAQYGIAKVNSTSSQLTIGQTSLSTSNFKFTTETVNGTYDGRNVAYYYLSTGYIYQSTIYFNTYRISVLPLEVKKYVAIHELGHTLGLKDIEDSRMYSYTVMYHETPTDIKYWFQDYQDFDKYNITWQYGE